MEKTNTEKIILNLGCGFTKVPRTINVDRAESCSPDIVVDLDQFPYPWKDNSVDGIMMYHVLEHLKDTPRVLEECYRILKNEGLMDIRVPHCSHDLALGDRYHNRVINDYTLTGFSSRSAEDMYASSYRFSIISRKIMLDRGFNWLLYVPQFIRNFCINHLRNVASESRYTLRKSVKHIAFTFDDGPSEFTTEILGILNALNIKATFFLLGENVLKFPGVTRAIYEEGHTIGVHGYKHERWDSIEVINREITLGVNAIKAVIPEIKLEYFRPTFVQEYFKKFPQMSKAISIKGLCSVDYTTTCEDWLEETTLEQIVQNTLRFITPGGNILLHDGYNQFREYKDRSKVVKAIVPIYMELTGRGYQVKTLKEIENGIN
jgi:peptidoglycan/xylan/chitin deacetylase (PgdA/CDA1 family)